MTFPAFVKQSALASAARHCCVCRRFKGLYLDVHHIKLESEGGSNDLSNAIALCFDCHGDAGHYNPKHPRGNRYSPQELAIHRDNWHRIVEEDGIQPPAEPSAVHCRYLVCTNFTDIADVCRGDLDNLPVSDAVVVANPVLEFQRQLIELHGNDSRGDEVFLQEYRSEESYLEQHGAASSVEQSNEPGYSYFHATRTLSGSEIEGGLGGIDPLSVFLQKAGVEPEDLAHAYTGRCECGGSGELEEHVRIRPLWTVYLAVSNLSDNPLRLSQLICQTEFESDTEARQFTYPSDTASHRLNLPRPAIVNGQTALIPLLTLFAPLRPVQYISHISIYRSISSSQGQTVSRSDLAGAMNGHSVAGPAIWPSTLVAETSRGRTVEPVHELDFSNLYVVSRHWMAGSCPQLFGRRSSASGLTYLGELFSASPGQVCTEKMDVDEGICCLIIAELEPETTEISEVRVNGTIVSRRTCLSQGEYLEIPVMPGDRVEIEGSYSLLAGVVPLAKSKWQTNELIEQFMWTSALSPRS